MRESWLSEIKKHRREPERRLALAREHLPARAAWREASAALRAMIRRRRKGAEPCDDLLRELYRLAGQHSLLRSARKSEPSNGSPPSAEAELPRRVWTNLEFPYERLGYRHLELLKSTDVKWFVEAWGEPVEHQMARDLYADLWVHSVEVHIEVLREALRSREVVRKPTWFERLHGRLAS